MSTGRLTKRGRVFQGWAKAGRALAGPGGASLSVDGWIASTRQRHWIANTTDRMWITTTVNRVWIARGNNE